MRPPSRRTARLSALHWSKVEGGAPMKLKTKFLCLIAVLFAVFIFAPPYMPLLEDPITGT